MQLNRIKHLVETKHIKCAFAAVMVEMAKQIPKSPAYKQALSITGAVPHVAETAMAMTEYLADEDLIFPFIGLERLYLGQGLYRSAIFWSEQCLETVQKRFGLDHLITALSMNNLARSYCSQGQYDLAKPLYINALELRRRILGENHSDVADSLNHLGGLYCY